MPSCRHDHVQNHDIWPELQESIYDIQRSVEHFHFKAELARNHGNDLGHADLIVDNEKLLAHGRIVPDLTMVAGKWPGVPHHDESVTARARRKARHRVGEFDHLDAGTLSPY
jgi:hypothetical protein